MDQRDGDPLDWPKVVSGDHEAFERVVNRHADLVYRFARRRTGNPTVAEDIAGQVFLEVWRQRDRVSLLEGSLRSWLLGVAANLVRRYRRSERRKSRALGRLPNLTATADHADEVADRLDQQLRLQHLRRGLESLPRTQAEVLLLRAWEQLSYEEIAEVLNIRIGTVRSRLSRARRHLEHHEDGTPNVDRALLDGENNSTGMPIQEAETRSAP